LISIDPEEKGRTDEFSCQQIKTVQTPLDDTNILKLLKGLAMVYIADDPENLRLCLRCLKNHSCFSEVVLEAVWQNGLALKYASPNLQPDQAVVLAAAEEAEAEAKAEAAKPEAILAEMGSAAKAYLNAEAIKKFAGIPLKHRNQQLIAVWHKQVEAAKAVVEAEKKLAAIATKLRNKKFLEELQTLGKYVKAEAEAKAATAPEAEETAPAPEAAPEAAEEETAPEAAKASRVLAGLLCVALQQVSVLYSPYSHCCIRRLACSVRLQF